MEAKTQYNDYLGTAAADIADGYDLNDFLKSRGVDIERYEAIGAKFYHGYAEFFSASILCIDKESIERKIVSLNFEEKFNHEQFFNLFKRFDVMVIKKTGDYEKFDIDDYITIDDRKQIIE